VFITFVLIFKFIFIYLLNVLFVLKIKDIFLKKSNQKMLKVVVFIDNYLHVTVTISFTFPL